MNRVNKESDCGGEMPPNPRLQETDSGQMYGDLMSEFAKTIPKKSYGDRRRLQTLAWAIIGLIISRKISLGSWGEVVIGRARKAASRTRRFSRWLHNDKINAFALYSPLLRNQLKKWSRTSRFRIALDTSVLPKGLVLIRISLIYRGRSVPIVWKVIAHNSAMVSYETYEPLLKRVQEVLPEWAIVELTADRGFFHQELIRFCKKVGWHYRLRAPSDTLVQRRGQGSRHLSDLCPPRGEAHFYHNVHILGVKIGPVHIALANPGWTEEEDPWYIVSDEITSLQTLDDYGLRFDIEESFLDDKSGGFQVEDSKIDTPEAMERLFLIIAIATLHLTSVGTAVVEQGKRRWVDDHWQRGMSYLKIGWQWVRQQFRKRWQRFKPFYLSELPDPEPAIASRKQSATPEIRFSVSFNPP